MTLESSLNIIMCFFFSLIAHHYFFIRQKRTSGRTKHIQCWDEGLDERRELLRYLFLTSLLLQWFLEG